MNVAFQPTSHNPLVASGLSRVGYSLELLMRADGGNGPHIDILLTTLRDGMPQHCSLIAAAQVSFSNLVLYYTL